jgi:hypothetical protein
MLLAIKDIDVVDGRHPLARLPSVTFSNYLLKVGLEIITLPRPFLRFACERLLYLQSERGFLALRKISPPELIGRLQE